MSDTPHLGLPLLAAAQAQKHVTMNDALLRLDALSAPSVVTASLSAPPPNANDGDTFLVASGASADWAGHEDELAFYINGGWSFAAPRPGWRVWLLDQGGHSTFTGNRWVNHLLGPIVDGAHGTLHTNTHDLELTALYVNSTPTMIPANSIVHCVSARVIEAITGDLVDWRLGVSTATTRYGTGMGTAKNSTAMGLTSNPLTYYSDEVVQVRPNGGTFSGGRIRICVHYIAFAGTDAV